MVLAVESNVWGVLPVRPEPESTKDPSAVPANPQPAENLSSLAGSSRPDEGRRIHKNLLEVSFHAGPEGVSAPKSSRHRRVIAGAHLRSTI
jgi:hypothetical protein